MSQSLIERYSQLTVVVSTVSIEDHSIDDQFQRVQLGAVQIAIDINEGNQRSFQLTDELSKLNYRLFNS